MLTDRKDVNVRIKRKNNGLSVLYTLVASAGESTTLQYTSSSTERDYNNQTATKVNTVWQKLFFPSVKSILSPEPNTRQSRARHRPLEDGPVLCTQGVPASWQRLSRSLLRGLVPPLDVDDLQYGQQQLESILDVGRAVGRLRGKKKTQSLIWFQNAPICGTDSCVCVCVCACVEWHTPLRRPRLSAGWGRLPSRWTAKTERLGQMSLGIEQKHPLFDCSSIISFRIWLNHLVGVTSTFTLL